MKKLLIAVAMLLSLSAAQAQNAPYGTPRYTPGYPTGRFYPVGDGVWQNNIAVPTLDTVVFVYPFSIFDEPINVASLNTRVQTGVASCSVKMVLFAHDIVSKRPTGTPIAGSNTGQDCSGSTTNQAVTVSIKLFPGVVYWAGFAVSTGASQFATLGTTGTPGRGIMGQLGKSALNSTVIQGFSAPYTFATDITTLNLAGATFTDVTTGGIPLLYLGN